MSYELDPIDNDGVTGGRYWLRSQIETILGQNNLKINANLDNESDVEDVSTTARIIADGTLADDYTDFRARRGSRGQYAATGTLPILDTDTDFDLVQYVTSLYAAYLLARHRVFTKGDVAENNQAMVDLKSEADDLYVQLFGVLQNYNPSLPKPGTITNVPLVRDVDRQAYPFHFNPIEDGGTW